MKISVEYFGQLQHITGIRNESVEVADGVDVTSLISQLAVNYGDRFRDFVLNEDGNLRKSIPIVINDRQIAYGETVLFQDGTRVMILSPIAGG